MKKGTPSQRPARATRWSAATVGFSARISASVCSSVRGFRSTTLTGHPAGSHSPGRPVATTSSRPSPASSTAPRTSIVDGSNQCTSSAISSPAPEPMHASRYRWTAWEISSYNLRPSASTGS